MANWLEIRHKMRYPPQLVLHWCGVRLSGIIVRFEIPCIDYFEVTIGGWTLTVLRFWLGVLLRWRCWWVVSGTNDFRFRMACRDYFLIYVVSLLEMYLQLSLTHWRNWKMANMASKNVTYIFIVKGHMS